MKSKNKKKLVIKKIHSALIAEKFKPILAKVSLG